MCKVVCAMGFGPIGFMTSFVSCDETSVPICGQTTAESMYACLVCARCGQSCLHLGSVLCSPQSGSCTVSTPASSFSKHFRQGFVRFSVPVMSQLCNGVCDIYKKCDRVSTPPWSCSSSM